MVRSVVQDVSRILCTDIFCDSVNLSISETNFCSCLEFLVEIVGRRCIATNYITRAGRGPEVVRVRVWVRSGQLVWVCWERDPIPE